MIVTCVSIWVKPEWIEKFIDATLKNHQGSIREDGNLRFDFLQSKNAPEQFLLYEVYENEEAVKNHKETAHYKEWRTQVEKMMDRPREGHGYTVVAPLDRELW